MKLDLNATHDPRLKSWVESANSIETDFPIQNLPFGIFRRAREEAPRIGVAIGERVLDLRVCLESGVLAEIDRETSEACSASSLNELMRLGQAHWSELRAHLSLLLMEDNPRLRDDRELVARALAPQSEVELLLPAQIGDYTDFYASIHHATNVGRMFRPDQPLLPNYKHLPVGYHGRASSIVVSGTGVRRPCGQTVKDEAAPVYGPSLQLDYELELGIFVGPGNLLGETISIDRAWAHIFGFCLVNDWSARDIQRWEYQPLGPFLAKSFATSISPWIVTAEALAPYRVAAPARPEGDPAVLPHLADAADQARGGLDLTLEVWLASERMRQAHLSPQRLSRGRFRQMYWTCAQMVAHHASNGCNLRSGDLLASGTVSGVERDERGCLLELTWRGSEPLALESGETRRFLEDGDEVILRGSGARAGASRVGFGECRGRILPAHD
jgi:fumarylacetoacetase